MRLNAERYRAILSEKQLSDDYVRKAAGLSEKRYLFILECGFTECETLEFIADAIGCPVWEIVKPEYEKSEENSIEWIRDSKTATLSLTQRRTITRVKRLAEKHPEECKILAENKDGSLYAKIPVEWIRINPTIDLTDEERQRRAEQMKRNIFNTD